MLVHSARTALTGMISLWVAKLSGLPEPYWAAITTLIVMQSDLGSAFAIAQRRFLGTALGAAMGAFLGSWFQSSIWVFGAGVFVLGMACLSLGKLHRTLEQTLDKTTYRYAGITLAIIILIPRNQTALYIATHRFLEVSIGIVVGLAMTSLWPEKKERERSR